MIFFWGGSGGGTPASPDPTKCMVYGYVLDAESDPVRNCDVIIELYKTTDRDYEEAAGAVIMNEAVTKTNINGYFEVELIRSSEYEGQGQYKITLKNKGLIVSSLLGFDDLVFTVPDQASADITDLLTNS